MATKTQAANKAGIVEVEGARLGYRPEGDGQRCLVVGSSIYYPRVFSQELREHLQLVFVDLRHFAASDPSFSPDRISIETYPDDIEHVRQILGLGEVVVIGHSIHGTIALEYARRYPEHVQGVVAVGTPPHRSDEDHSPSERFWEADASAERKEILARRLAELTHEVRAALSSGELWAQEYVANGPKIWFDPAYDGSWLWEGVVLDWPVFERVAGELFKPYDLAQGPAEIAVPVLVAHGRYDYYVAYTLWEEHLHKLAQHTYRSLRAQRAYAAARGAGAVQPDAPSVGARPREFIGRTRLAPRRGHFPSLANPRVLTHLIHATQRGRPSERCQARARWPSRVAFRPGRPAALKHRGLYNRGADIRAVPMITTRSR